MSTETIGQENNLSIMFHQERRKIIAFLATNLLLLWLLGGCVIPEADGKITAPPITPKPSPAETMKDVIANQAVTRTLTVGKNSVSIMAMPLPAGFGGTPANRQELGRITDVISQSAGNYFKLFSVAQAEINLEALVTDTGLSGATSEVNMTPQSIRLNATLPRDFTQEQIVHEVYGHGLEQIYIGTDYQKVFLNDDRYLEGLAELIAFLTNPQMRTNPISNFGENFNTKASALPSFFLNNTQPEISKEQDDIFGFYYQQALYKAFARHWERVFKESKVGFTAANIQGFLETIGKQKKNITSPDKLTQITASYFGYSVPADFVKKYPFLSTETAKSGEKRLLAYVRDTNILEALYFKMDNDKNISGSPIMPVGLKGKATVTITMKETITQDGKSAPNMVKVNLDVNGSGSAQLPVPINKIKTISIDVDGVQDIINF